MTNFFYDVTNNLKNHPIVSAFGYIFESLHNTLFGKSQINYLLYTPTLNNFPLFKNFALYVVPITLGITIMTFIVFIVMFALTLFKRIDINIKDVVVGSIIKTNGTGEVAPFVKDNSMHTQPIEQEKDIIDSLSKVCKVYTKSIHVLDNFK